MNNSETKELLEKQQNNDEFNNKNNKETLEINSEVKLNNNYIFRSIYVALQFFFSAISIYFYYLSLEGCDNTMTYCLVNLNPEFFNMLFYYMLLSTSIFSIIFFLFTIGKCSKYIVLIDVISFLLLFKYDNGSDLKNHGSYNRGIFLIFSTFITIFISLVYYLFYVILVKNKQIFRFGTTIFFIFIISYIFNQKLINSCNTWYNGLGDESMDNSVSKCAIIKPNNCWQNILDGILDVSYIIREDCNQFRFGEKQELFKYLEQFNEDFKINNENKDEHQLNHKTKSTNFINLAYPNTANWNWVPHSFFENYQKLVLRNIRIVTDLDNTLKNKQDGLNLDKVLDPEIFVQFNSNGEENDLGKVYIDIRRNETLISERRENFKEFKSNLYDNAVNSIKDGDSKNHNIQNMKKKIKILDSKLDHRKNILVIYVDCISRVHFLRKMPKTASFIEKFYNGKSKDLESFQFFKYHNFHVVTPWGVHPMFYGRSFNDFKGTHITRHLKKLGYITGQSNNICSREMYDIEEEKVANMDFDNFDHENNAIFCDPNFTNIENPYTPYLGPYSIKKRCLYGKNTFEYVLEYGEAFWRQYVGERRYLKLAFQDAHEGTGEVARYLDEYLSDFLFRMYHQGLLINTSISFVSDHGNKMIGLYQLFNCEDFIKEGPLGMLFIIIPKDEDYDRGVDNINFNKHQMISPYDLFPTLLDFSGYFHIKNFYKDLLVLDYLDSDIKNEIKKDYENSIFNYDYFEESSSLFNKVNTDRNCDTFSYDMKPLYCRCN